MSHVEERLQERFGITGISPSKLKHYTLNYGDLIFTDKAGTDFYSLELEGNTVYPVVRNEVVVTVYWSSFIQNKIKKLFGHNKKKFNKLMKRISR